MGKVDQGDASSNLMAVILAIGALSVTAIVPLRFAVVLAICAVLLLALETWGPGFDEKYVYTKWTYRFGCYVVIAIVLLRGINRSVDPTISVVERLGVWAIFRVDAWMTAIAYAGSIIAGFALLVLLGSAIRRWHRRSEKRLERVK